MKRRTLLAGLAAATATIAGSGLFYNRWSNRNVVRYQSLDHFDAAVKFDVCIIGTGPAGTTLATRLGDSGKRVLLLESGSSIHDTEGMQAASSLDAYSSSGEVYARTVSAANKAVSARRRSAYSTKSSGVKRAASIS